MTLDLQRARARARQGRREPPLRDRRRRRCCARSRSCPASSCGWRWSSARSASGSPRGPGGRAYGAPSVLAQLACEVRVRARDPAHGVPSGPERRLGARRDAPARRRGRGRLAGAARARRRRLRAPAQDARRLARARPGGRAGRSREEVRAALEQLGQPADARAERLSPAGLPRAGADPWTVSSELRRCARWRRRRSTSACSSARVRESDGRHELATVMQSISLADELDARAGAAAGAGGDELVCPGVPGPPEREPRRARAARVPRAHRLGGAAAAADDRQAHPASPRASAAARPTPPPRCGSPRAPPGSATRSCCSSSRAALGADVPAQVSPGRWLAIGRRRAARARCRDPAAPFGVLVLPLAGVELSTAAVYAEADRLGLARDARRARRAATRSCASALGPRRAAAGGERAAAQRPAARRRLAVPARSPRRCARRATAGAALALVSGSGPDRRRAVRRAPREEGLALARLAAARARPARPGAGRAVPVDAAFGERAWTRRAGAGARRRAGARRGAPRRTPTAPCATILPRRDEQSTRSTSS